MAREVSYCGIGRYVFSVAEDRDPVPEIKEED